MTKLRDLWVLWYYHTWVIHAAQNWVYCSKSYTFTNSDIFKNLHTKIPLHIERTRAIKAHTWDRDRCTTKAWRNVFIFVHLYMEGEGGEGRAAISPSIHKHNTNKSLFVTLSYINQCLFSHIIEDNEKYILSCSWLMQFGIRTYTKMMLCNYLRC